jgi:hypothetical protein
MVYILIRPWRIYDWNYGWIISFAFDLMNMKYRYYYYYMYI